MQDVVALLTSTVIFLFAQDSSGAFPIGTGFVVGYPAPGKPGKVIPLVVTAKHVIGDHTKLFGRFSAKDGKSPVLAYDVTQLRRSGDFWENPNLGVDIVVFRTEQPQTASYSPFPLELIASKEKFRAEAIRTTDQVIFPGLLVHFMGDSRNYPIVRTGSIALIPDEEIPLRYRIGSKLMVTRQEAILLDGTAVQGESGSPVFLSPTPRQKGNTLVMSGTTPLLLGVLHGFYNAPPRETQNIPANASQTFSENANIAIVFPSWKLLEILHLKALVSRMEQIAKMIP